MRKMETHKYWLLKTCLIKDIADYIYQNYLYRCFKLPNLEDFTSYFYINDKNIYFRKVKLYSKIHRHSEKNVILTVDNNNIIKDIKFFYINDLYHYYIIDLKKSYISSIKIKKTVYSLKKADDNSYYAYIKDPDFHCSV